MADLHSSLLDSEENKYASLISCSSSDEDGHFSRTGTVWTATAHIVTAVIGAGVLSLAWSIAQLGWIAGPVAMIIVASITLYSTLMLADCYRFPDSVTGPNRNYTYKDAVSIYLGARKAWMCGLFQYIILYGTSVAYVITASISMRAIRKSNCYHKYGHDVPCNYSEYTYMILFGIIQIMVSQIPNFDQIWWLSIVAAIMSFSYSTIGLGLGLAKVIEQGQFYGSIGGISVTTTFTTAQKVWRIFRAVGDIAFAYPYSYIVIEIEDTLKSPPPEKRTMKKASFVSIMITTFFYMLCGCFGYAAFGDNAPGNLLTGFGFYEPYWLVDFANACIAVHLVGAYQVFCQPFFAFGEGWFSRKWPNNRFINYQHGISVPLVGSFNMNFFKLFWRTAVVLSTTAVAMLFPYFNNVLGILGSISFWPLATYFPVEMYIVRNKFQRWSLRWILFKSFSFICLLISLAALAGSIEGIV